jgi:aminomethyltransferase
MLANASRRLARIPALARGYAAAAGELRKTPLHETHKALGGKMVPFGGWDMPVQYPEGILKSHLHTREAAGLFDVSHMLGVMLRGKDRVAFMETLCTSDLKALPDGMGALAVLTNAEGGIIDDCIVTNGPDYLYMVINAGHEDKDLPHIKGRLESFVAGGGDVSMETLPNNGILALQGPKAAGVLQAPRPPAQRSPAPR